jgi:hypothetical protein
MAIAARPPHPKRRISVFTIKNGLASRKSPPGTEKLQSLDNQRDVVGSHILAESRRGGNKEYTMFGLAKISVFLYDCPSVQKDLPFVVGIWSR